MDEQDRSLRNATYRLFVTRGRAPTCAEVGRELGVGPASVAAGWRRLHDAHALVLNVGTAEIRMANPFSAVPTAYRVQAASRWWYANCAWDAIGVCAALHVDGRIETSCPDCADPLTVTISHQQPDPTDLLFHCLVPAAGWWENIVFT
jgi:Alkylmercury lyase